MQKTLHSLVEKKKVKDLRRLIEVVLKSNVSGSFWECGVYSGGTADIIRSMIPNDRKLYLFDSFEGLPEPAKQDNHHKKGDFDDINFEEIQEHFSKFDNVTLVKGWIPDTFSIVPEEPIAFCHLDLDLYEGYRDTLNHVWPKLCSGGIICLDDYKVSSCQGATDATDEFVKENNISVIDDYYIQKP